jgi:hypothetical protein
MDHGDQLPQAPALAEAALDTADGLARTEPADAKDNADLIEPKPGDFVDQIHRYSARRGARPRATDCLSFGGTRSRYRGNHLG